MNQAPQDPSFASDCTNNDGVAKKTSAVSDWLIQPYSMAIAIVALFVLISGMASFLCYRQYEDAKTKALSADQMTSELLAVFIREREKAAIGLLQAYADRSSLILALKNQDKAALRRHLAELKKNVEVDLVLIANHEGILQAGNPLLQNAVGKNLSGQKWYREVAARRQPYISPVVKLSVSNPQPAVVIYVPIWDEREDLIGVLATAQRLDFIARGIEKLQLSAAACVSVIDGSGHIFFSNRYTYQDNITSYPVFAATAQAFKDNKRQIAVGSGGGFGAQKYLSLTAINHTGWKVVTERQQKDILQAAYWNFTEIAFISFLLFATLSISFIYLRKVFLFRKTKDLLQTEIKLRQSEYRLKELFENMSSCVAIYEAVADGRDFTFKEINKAA